MGGFLLYQHLYTLMRKYKIWSAAEQWNWKFITVQQVTALEEQVNRVRAQVKERGEQVF